MSSGSTEPGAVDSRSLDAAPRGEVAALIGIQSVLAQAPGVLPTARTLSHVGEHALGWVTASAVGWAIARTRDDTVRQRRFVAAGVGAFGAHAASVVVKRVVRRQRPRDPRIVVGVWTPSRLSFPSSHATSTTAAAILLGRAVGAPPAVLPAVLVPPMLVSRLVLGVHYPSDVAAGAALGAACAVVVARNDRLAAALTARSLRNVRAIARGVVR